MKKFIALLTATLFVFSACLLSACGGETKTAIEKQKVDLATLSTEELLALSFADSFASDNVLTILAERAFEPADMTAGAKLEINDLSVMGEKLLDDPISIIFSSATDVDNSAVKADVSVSLLGETLPISILVDESGLYATDILGLNDKAIGISYEELEPILMGLFAGGAPMDKTSSYEDILLGTEYDDVFGGMPTDYDAVIDAALAQVFGENFDEILGDEYDFIYDIDYDALLSGDIQGFIDGFMSDTELTQQITLVLEELLGWIGTTVENAIMDNMDEDTLKQEIKDVTVEGTEFKGAYVVSLTINGADVLAVIEDIIAGLQSHELFGPLYGYIPLDLSQYEAELDSISLKITNILSADAEAVSNEIVLSGMGTSAAVRCVDIDTKESIKIGLLNANGEFAEELGVIFYDYTWDQDAKTECGAFGATLNGATETYVKFEGDYDGDKHDGRFSVLDGENELFGFDYMIKGDDLCGEIAISKIKFTDGNESILIDVEFAYSFNIFVEGAEVEYSIKGEMEGVAVDMSASAYTRYEDVKITAPDEYVSVLEMNEMTLINWLNDFSEKYPKIFEAINDASMGYGSAYDSDFDYNDYSIDLDDYSIDLDDYDFDYSIDLDDYDFDF